MMKLALTLEADSVNVQALNISCGYVYLAVYPTPAPATTS
nr:type IV toxin-antitoxin system YeeU family antitoxin [Shigella flexneri]